MDLWNRTDAMAATGGQAMGGDWQANGVSIDTRTLVPGDLFVALSDVRDGHEFVAAALAKGAVAALVSRVPEGLSSDASLLVVADVLVALQDLGRAARARTRAKVVGVTGSVGKTSTKEMLRVTLGGQGRVHAAEASYNNHWGVPLTLARMPADADFAVIEIGMNHPGEIAPLARLARLEVAIITTVAAAHLEAFADVAAIAVEKAAIIDGLVQGGVAVLPIDLEVSPTLLDRAAQAGARIITFGADARADFRLTEAILGDEVTVVRAETAGAGILFKVRSPGRHFAMNGLAVLAVVAALGLEPVVAGTDLGTWAPPPGRGGRERVTLDIVDQTAFDLIDDAFNANPASMAAALDVLIAARPVDGTGRLGKGRRIAILGDMLELGPTEAILHAQIASHPGLQAVTLIHCVGQRMKSLHDALPRGLRGEWVATAPELLVRLRSMVDAGDVMLVKGSKGSKVSILVDGLRKLGQPAPSWIGDA